MWKYTETEENLMARRYITVSDLTGNEIKEGERAELRILNYPTLDHPVKLDVQALEVQSLVSRNDDLVTVEIVVPGDDEATQVLVPLKEFDALFSNSVDDVLGGAERYSPGGEAAAPRRRGRPAGSANKPKAAAKPTGSGMSKEQLASIREWLRANGHEVSDRGRISSKLLGIWEEAHQSA